VNLGRFMVNQNRCGAPLGSMCVQNTSAWTMFLPTTGELPRSSEVAAPIGNILVPFVLRYSCVPVLYTRFPLINNSP
jgi:hypothetical protein